MIVVGAGVEGSATAYTLTSSGKRNILLLEQVGLEKCGERETREQNRKGSYIILFNFFSLIEDIQEVVLMVDHVSQGGPIIKAIM